MNRNEAIEALKAGGSVEFASKDATGSHWTYAPVWLDDDGDLVRSNPTGRGTVLVKDRDLGALRVA